MCVCVCVRVCVCVCACVCVAAFTLFFLFLSPIYRLLSTHETAFSRVTAGWGMGPRGNMERLDMIHGNYPGFMATRRRDWFGDCLELGAADPRHAQTCPNDGKG